MEATGVSNVFLRPARNFLKIPENLTLRGCLFLLLRYTSKVTADSVESTLVVKD